MLAERGVRVSLGAQSFGHAQLAVLERRATPDQVRARRRARCAPPASPTSRSTCSSASPAMGRAELDRDLDEALALAPEHLSCYELEAKPGTRFTHRHGAELARQAELLEDHYEHVIARLQARRLPLVRDRQLLPRRPRARSTTWPTGRAATTSASASAPSRRSGSSGARTGRRWPGYVDALERRRGAAALDRAADARRARAGAPAARAAARRAARDRRARSCDRSGRPRAHGGARASSTRPTVPCGSRRAGACSPTTSSRA